MRAAYVIEKKKLWQNRSVCIRNKAFFSMFQVQYPTREVAVFTTFSNPDIKYRCLNSTMKLSQSEWKLFANRVGVHSANKRTNKQTSKHINMLNILSVVVLTKGRKVCWVTRTVRCLASPLVCYTWFCIAWNYHKQSKHFFLTLNYFPNARERLKWMRCLHFCLAIKRLTQVFRKSYGDYLGRHDIESHYNTNF